MKERLIILMIVILGIVAAGCNNKIKDENKESNTTNQRYEDIQSKGKTNVIEEQYDKAIDYFKLALEEKSEDKEATNLIKQLDLLLEAQSAESNKNYILQIQKIDKINSIKTETNVVKEKANDYKEIILKNIDESIDSIEYKINNGEYKDAQKNLEDYIKEFKKSDSLKVELERCNELLKTCEAKNKEIEQNQVSSNSNSNSNSNKVWCEGVNHPGHYVDNENFIDDLNRCNGCNMRRDLSSTFTYEDCSVCGESSAVSLQTGKCQYCGAKTHPAVKEIYDDGTVVFEDGSTM